MNYTKTRILLAFVVAFGALVVLGCASSAKTIREISYPQGFEYLSDEELSTTMGRLAENVVALDTALQDDESTQSQYNADLLVILRSMRTEAASLSRKAETNHPRIDRFLPALLEDIDRAITAAENQSENYFYAGAVIGACEYCHVPRHKPMHRDPVSPELT